MTPANTTLDADNNLYFQSEFCLLVKCVATHLYYYNRVTCYKPSSFFFVL